MRKLILSNVAEGTHAGNITKVASAAITRKYLLCKLIDSEKIAITAATDTPIGVVTDEATEMGDIVNVALLGNFDTLRAIAGSSVAVGDILVPAADGKVQSLPTTSGTYLQVGIALNTALPDGVVECVSCVPVQRVVSE